MIFGKRHSTKNATTSAAERKERKNAALRAFLSGADDEETAILSEDFTILVPASFQVEEEKKHRQRRRSSTSSSSSGEDESSSSSSSSLADGRTSSSSSSNVQINLNDYVLSQVWDESERSVAMRVLNEAMEDLESQLDVLKTEIASRMRVLARDFPSLDGMSAVLPMKCILALEAQHDQTLGMASELDALRARVQSRPEAIQYEAALAAILAIPALSSSSSSYSPSSLSSAHGWHSQTEIYEEAKTRLEARSMLNGTKLATKLEF